MEIKIDNMYNARVCIHCNGTGKLKAMQSRAQIGGPSIRGKDKEIKCKYCNGRGVVTSR